MSQDTNVQNLIINRLTKAQYESIANPSDTELYLIPDDSSGGGTSRNIGEIVSSAIPLTDAGLHLLDGALIQGDGIYSDFVDYMADLYGDGTDVPSYFTDETSWQSSVSTYGVCGKFVYDSTNNTVRLPKITGIIEGTTDLTALGDLVEAGLPNITGSFHITRAGTSSGTGAITATYGNGYGEGSNGSYGSGDVTFDASRSNPIYGNSTTVQPQTIKAFFYIVIATSTKTDIEVDIDQVAADLNTKVSTGDLAEVQCVIEVSDPSLMPSYYYVRSDGWCVQGGSGSSGTITFLKPFIDTNYTVTTRMLSGSGSVSWGEYGENTNKTTTTFTVGSRPVSWRAEGYII